MAVVLAYIFAFLCLFYKVSPAKDFFSKNLTCLSKEDSSKWQSNLYYSGQILPIIIDISERPSHIVVSSILKILLEEILNFPLVKFNQIKSKNDNLDQIYKRLSQKNLTSSPKSHINVEVWEKYGKRNKLNNNPSIINCGPLGPTAKKGVFISSKSTSKPITWRKFKENCNSSCESNLVSNQYNLDLNLNSYIISWYPNTLTIKKEYENVLFPDCPNGDNESNMYCDLQLYELTKLVWDKLKSHASDAFWLVSNFTLSQMDYIKLLEQIESKNNVKSFDHYHQIACDWINNNRHKWQKWLPNINSPYTVYLPILLSDYGPWKINESYNASVETVERLNDLITVDHKVQIKPIIMKLPCDEYKILDSYLSIMKLYESRIIGSVVCLCPQSFDTIIKYSNIKRQILISSSVDVPRFHNYTFFFSTQPNFRIFNLILLKLLSEQKWKRVVILKKDDHLLDMVLFQRYNVEILDVFSEPEGNISEKNLEKFLRNAKETHRASIYIVDYFDSGTELVLRSAYKLGMEYKTGYVFIVSPYVNSVKFKIPISTANHIKDDSVNTYPDYFRIQHNPVGEHNFRQFRIPISSLRSHIMMAIRHLGESFQQMLREIPNAYYFINTPQIARKFVSLLNTSKKIVAQAGIQYRTSFDKDHYAGGPWEVQRISHFESEFENNQEPIILPIYYWAYENGFDNSTNLPMIIQRFNGLSDKIPHTISNAQDCAVYRISEAFKLNCTLTILVLHIIPIVTIILILLFVLLYCRRKIIISIPEEMSKKEFEELCQELNDIDINSTDVIINTQVGKGAFGIVFGGEAKKNNRWETVAIKLIEKEADWQGKLDFLMEAKLMRGLEHKNIVRLIGICLNPGKPVIYLVMELVLNGDLKDYLLSNRINAKNDPNIKNVCPNKLTGFVIDIAHGVQYLHNNGLLHRDLACRNCFLSEDDVVKIGDFGLTRKINDAKEYYRIGRHFVLPARWMPPESIDLGYFSIQSDIWSFGVIIFEIVTFCTKPYIDITDDEVPELIKNNIKPLISYLPIQAHLSHVYRLIDKCCKYQRTDRFESIEPIIDYLNQYPNCIQPFLTEDPPHLTCPTINKRMSTYYSESTTLSDSGPSSGLFPWKKSQSRSNINTGFTTNSNDHSPPSLQPSHQHISYVDANNEDLDNQIYRALNEATSMNIAEQTPFLPKKSTTNTPVVVSSTTNNTTNHLAAGSVITSDFARIFSNDLIKIKFHKQTRKRKSNLNNLKSRSSDLTPDKIDDEPEFSYVSCPDNQQHQLLPHSSLIIDPQDFKLTRDHELFPYKKSSISSTKKFNQFYHHIPSRKELKSLKHRPSYPINNDDIALQNCPTPIIKQMPTSNNNNTNYLYTSVSLSNEPQSQLSSIRQSNNKANFYNSIISQRSIHGNKNRYKFKSHFNSTEFC